MTLENFHRKKYQIRILALQLSRFDSEAAVLTSERFQSMQCKIIQPKAVQKLPNHSNYT